MQHHFSGAGGGTKWPTMSTMGTKDTAPVLTRLPFIGACTWKTESLILQQYAQSTYVPGAVMDTRDPLENKNRHDAHSYGD